MIATEHGSGSGEFDAGEVIIHHVSNSSIDHPILELPTIFGINFSITKHVLMIWLVAILVFTVITWAIRRYTKQE